MSAGTAAAVLRSHVAPRVGIVLGSGLGAVADAVEDAVSVGYDELPGFPRPTVHGHAGRAVLGHLRGVPVCVLMGRAHLYEGGDPAPRVTPVRALAAAGAEVLVLTNAAGSLRPEVGPGRLMAISDHINLTGHNPLIGPNDEAIGPRFPSLAGAYDPALLADLHASAGELGIDLAEGVYLAVSGPSFETPAEIRAFRDPGRRRGRHVDRPRDDPRPPRRAARGGRLGHLQPRRRAVRRAAEPRADPDRRRSAPPATSRRLLEDFVGRLA